MRTYYEVVSTDAFEHAVANLEHNRRLNSANPANPTNHANPANPTNPANPARSELQQSCNTAATQLQHSFCAADRMVVRKVDLCDESSWPACGSFDILVASDILYDRRALLLLYIYIYIYICTI
jgi:predicted nicotinamide N-methyase